MWHHQHLQLHHFIFKSSFFHLDSHHHNRWSSTPPWCAIATLFIYSRPPCSSPSSPSSFVPVELITTLTSACRSMTSSPSSSSITKPRPPLLLRTQWTHCREHYFHLFMLVIRGTHQMEFNMHGHLHLSIIHLFSIPNVLHSKLVHAANFLGFLEAMMTKMEDPCERLLDLLKPLVTIIVTDALLFWIVEVECLTRLVYGRHYAWWVWRFNMLISLCIGSCF